MNRQYIGARYVPKFYEGSNGNEWDVNVPYEPFTIVTYLGNSYTSKVPVPANVGAPNLNPTYWVLTSNYSAQIEEYRQITEECKESVDDLEQVVYKKYAMIADSYGDPTVSGNSTSVITEFQSAMGLTENIDFVYVYAGGHGFVSDGTRTFLKLLDDLKDKVDTGTVEFGDVDVTDLIVVGGDNDAWHTKAQIDSAIATFVAQAKTYFPNATIHIGEIGNVKANSTNHVNIGNITIPAYMDSVKEGCHYLTGVETVMLDYANYTADDIHPNGTGMTQLGTAIKQALISKYENILNETVTLTLDGNDISSTTSNVGVTIRKHNDTIDVTLNGSVDNGAGTIAGYTTKVIGTIPSDLIRGTVPNSFGIVILRTATSELTPAIAYIEGQLLKVIFSKDLAYGQVTFVLSHFSIPSYLN